MSIHRATIFCSHSRHDIDIRNFFTNIFAHVGLRGLFYEWQRQYTGYAGQEITNAICDPDTVAVFVLLGRNLANPTPSSRVYTHNWVSFEIGIASCAGKPIWVFEDFGSFIRYPIPFVTDYAQYSIGHIPHLQFYGDVFQDKFVYQTNQIPLMTPTFRCHYTDCNAIYNCWSIALSFNCPVCRRRIPIPAERTQFSVPFPSNVV